MNNVAHNVTLWSLLSAKLLPLVHLAAVRYVTISKLGSTPFAGISAHFLGKILNDCLKVELHFIIIIPLANVWKQKYFAILSFQFSILFQTWKTLKSNSILFHTFPYCVGTLAVTHSWVRWSKQMCSILSSDLTLARRLDGIPEWVWLAASLACKHLPAPCPCSCTRSFQQQCSRLVDLSLAYSLFKI